MCLQGYPSTASTSWSISNDTVAVSRWGRPWACTYLDLGVRPLHLEEGKTPNVVRREHWSQRNNQGQEAEVRHGYAPWCEAYKNERTVSEQRLKRRGEAAVYLLGRVLARHWLILAGRREVNDGEKEGGIERKNDRMKVFIGVEGGWHVYSWNDWSRGKVAGNQIQIQSWLGLLGFGIDPSVKMVYRFLEGNEPTNNSASIPAFALSGCRNLKDSWHLSCFVAEQRQDVRLVSTIELERTKAVQLYLLHIDRLEVANGMDRVESGDELDESTWQSPRALHSDLTISAPWMWWRNWECHGVRKQEMTINERQCSECWGVWRTRSIRVTVRYTWLYFNLSPSAHLYLI